NPLTTINAYVQLLEMTLEEEPENKLRPMVSKISRAVLRLRDLIDQLLNLSMIETGNLNYEMKKLDLRKLVNDWEESFRLTHEDALIKIEGLCDCEINGDEYRLEQVF